MGSVVRKITKPIKKVVKKVTKSPLGKAALLAGGGYFLAPSLFAGGAGLGSLTTGVGRQVFFQEALKRAAINAAAQGLGGGKVDLKSALVSGGVGAFVPTVGPISGIQNQVLREAAIGGITNLGTQAALGRDVNLKQAALAGGISGGLQGLQNLRQAPGVIPGQEGFDTTDLLDDGTKVAQPTFRESMANVNLRRGIATPQVARPVTDSNIFEGAFALEEYDPPGAGVGFEPISGKLGQTAQTRITPVEPGVAGEVVEGAVRRPTIGERLSGVGEGIKGIFEKDATVKDRASSALGSLKELTGTAADRPIISAVALGTLVASANAPQEEDETDQEFKKRKSNVSKYLRQYGSKFYSGDELDTFVNSYLTEYAKGGVVSLNTPRDMYLEGGKVYLEEGGRPEDMVSYTDFPGGVIYMDPEGNPISKEEFLRRTMEAEEEEERQIKQQLDIDEDKEAPSIKKAEGGLANSKEGLKIDTMGDLSEGDMGMFRSMKNTLIEKILRDRPGSASNILEALNPFDDKDVDKRGGAFRREQYSEELKDVINNLIATKDKPKERSNFIKTFEKKYDTSMGMKEAPSIKKAEGGIAEIDLREKGGFVPMGKKEKADDVPAMLSKNEFVLTADAVRGIGKGNVEKGAQRLYDLMGEAEKVGRGVA
jgi:hypothetical protein